MGVALPVHVGYTQTKGPRVFMPSVTRAFTVTYHISGGTSGHRMLEAHQVGKVPLLEEWRVRVRVQPVLAKTVRSSMSSQGSRAYLQYTPAQLGRRMMQSGATGSNGSQPERGFVLMHVRLWQWHVEVVLGRKGREVHAKGPSAVQLEGSVQGQHPG